MMDEQEIKQALAKVCNSTSWTWVRNEGHVQVWKCNACGAITKDNLTLSGALIYGPHYKPGYEPEVMGS